MSIRNVVVSLFVLALVAGPVLGEEIVTPTSKPASKPASRPADYKLTGYYGVMSNQLKLDEATKAKIIEKIKAQRSFATESKPKMEAARKALAAANTAKDAAAIAKAEKEIKEIDLAGERIRAKTHMDINDIVGVEKRMEWETITTVQYAETRLNPIKFDDAQMAKIKDLAKGLAKDLAAARDANFKALSEATAETKVDEKKIAEIHEKLVDAVTQTILTDAQKKQLAELKAAAEAADAAEAASKPADKKTAEPKK